MSPVALRCVVIGMFLSCSSAIVGSLGRYMLSAPLFGVMECFVHRSVHNTGTGHPLIAIASPPTAAAIPLRLSRQ